jgi:hypothetical protein
MLSCSAEPHELTSIITTGTCLGPFTVLDTSKMGQDSDAGGASRPVVLNPYLLFGQSRLWPRGMTTQSLLDGGPFCFTRQPARPLIQQALTNGQSDAASGFRPFLQGTPAGGVSQQQRSEVQFDATAFSVVLPAGVLEPISRCVCVLSQWLYCGFIKHSVCVCGGGDEACTQGLQCILNRP